jgi:hypothetical protein
MQSSLDLGRHPLCKLRSFIQPLKLEVDPLPQPLGVGEAMSRKKPYGQEIVVPSIRVRGQHREHPGEPRNAFA